MASNKICVDLKKIVYEKFQNLNRTHPVYPVPTGPLDIIFPIFYFGERTEGEIEWYMYCRGASKNRSKAFFLFEFCYILVGSLFALFVQYTLVGRGKIPIYKDIARDPEFPLLHDF